MKRLVISFVLAGLMILSVVGVAAAHNGGPSHNPCGNPNVPQHVTAHLCGH